MRRILSFGAHFAQRCARGILLPGALAACTAMGAQAQGAASPVAPPGTAGFTVNPAPPDSVFDSSTSIELAQGARRDAEIGLNGWDHTLLGAFELGERLIHLADAAIVPGLGVPGFGVPGLGVRAHAADPASSFLRYSGSDGRPTLDSIAKALRVDQLQRQGMNLHMSSPFGSFRVTYREIFAGRANSLGGGVGQASAAAMYTTPRFGTGRLMDFSAAALMGDGQINQLLGTGFGSSVIGGNGPALRKAAGPTVALKLTF